MKSLKFLLLAVILLIVCACANESYEERPTPSEPPSEQTHSVTPEKALSELDAVFAGLEEKGTRSGGGRPRIGSMLSVKAADVMPTDDGDVDAYTDDNFSSGMEIITYTGL